jgi:isoleucyl-tRNA synthetase
MNFKQEAFKAVLAMIRTWVVEKLWPFFVEEIWPTIREYVVEAAIAATAHFGNKVKKWFDARNTRQQEENVRKQEEIKKKAAEAAERAKQAKSAEEAEKYTMATKIYEEFLEDLKMQNKQLRSELEELKEILQDGAKSAKADVEAKVSEKPPEHLHIQEKINEQVALLEKPKKE